MILPMVKRSLRTLAALAGVVWMLFPVGTPAAVGEYTAKAAYLLNFPKFVTWPKTAFAGATAPFLIGVVGGDPFEGTLESTVAGKSVDGRPIQIRRGTAAETRKCHIVFLAGASASDSISALSGASVLTVSDDPQFAARGGMIQFTTEGSKIALVINNGSAKKAGLVLSSKLLQIAKQVR